MRIVIIRKSKDQEELEWQSVVDFQAVCPET